MDSTEERDLPLPGPAGGLLRRLPARPSDVIGLARAHLVTVTRQVRIGRRVRILGTVRVRNSGGRIVLDDRVLIDGRHQAIAISAGPGARLRLGVGVFMNYGGDIACAGEITIGAFTRIGPRVTIADHHGHDVDRNSRDVPRAVIIGDDVWLGRSAMILPGVTIGRGTVVAAGSIVTKSLPECVVAVGAPAVPIREIDFPPGTHR